MNRPPHASDWDNTLARYMAGELSPSEREEVRRWLAANPDDARAIESLERATRGLAARPVDVEAALAKVKTRIRRGTPWRTYAWLAAAAVIILVLGPRVMTDSQEGLDTTPREYATRVGGRDSITLADGSSILLGPDSRAIVTGREVRLTGEAFFVVTHDEERPFIVHAGGAVIRDIGTEFSVHSDASDEVRVVVREGSVQLTQARDSVVLQPGDVGVRKAGGGVQASRGAATDDDLAWTRGRLVFRDASLGELGADLRRWYGVELRVTDTALLRRHFTGSFANEPVSRVMEVIALALGARADRRGDTVFIRPAPRSSTGR